MFSNNSKKLLLKYRKNNGRSLPQGPRGLAVSTCCECRRSWVRIPPRKILFFTIYSIYRVECKKLFCKTNIKLKVLKLNKTKLLIFKSFKILIF